MSDIRHFLGVIVLLLGISGLFAPNLHAQTTPDLEQGMRPYGASSGGDFDKVDLANGKLNVTIPLLSYPQRGGKLKLGFTVQWNSLVVDVDKTCIPGGDPPCIFTQGVVNNGLGSSGQFYLSSTALISWGDITNTQNNIIGYTVTFPDGSTHEFAPLNGNTSGTAWESVDATGMSFNSSTHVVTDASGVRYNFTTQGDGYVLSSIQDPNGNEITYNSSTKTWTDTFSRQIPDINSATTTTNYSGCTGTTAKATVWTVPGLTINEAGAMQDGSESFKFCYGYAPMNFTIDYGYDYVFNINVLQLQTIVLPNDTTWVFEYDPQYAALASITLPTGGTISYAWNAPVSVPCRGSSYPINYYPTVATRTINDGSEHIWTYSGLSPTPSTVSVTDPLGDVTDHAMTALNSDMYYETQTLYYQYPSTLLKTVTTTYNSDPIPFFIQQMGACALLANVTPATITTTWANNKVSSISKTYDGGFNIGQSWNPTYGKVIRETDSDYGVGGPGSTLRTISTQYEAFINSSYLGNNILDIPSSVTTAGGGITATTTYQYDSGGLQPSGASQLVTPPNSARGNATAITQCINTSCNVSAITTKTYWDTGLQYQVTNPNNGVTTYQYSSSSAFALPTQIKDPLQHVNTYTYDFNTALLTSVTDPNQQTTYYQYDPMWRIFQVNYPDAGLAKITRQETSFPFSATLADKMGFDESEVTTNVFDGLGRVTQGQTEDPVSTDYVDTTYDGLGRVESVSNPYRQQSDPTYGITSYTYDSLGRKTSVHYPTGAIAYTSYTGAATEVQDEGNGTYSVSRVSQMDGLGHMISVCEVSSTNQPFGGGSSPASCSQDISTTGFLTSYSRDAMGNLLGVTQSGLNPRSFAYDSLSRLTNATNPESGTTTYTYDGNNNVLTRTAPLPNQTGTQTVTTTYTYDADNRILTRSYNDGKTPGDVFCYDNYPLCPGGGNPTPTNAIGRLFYADASGRSETWNSYDPMGRVINQWQCVPEDCGIGSLTFSYSYDLMGDMLTASNGEGVTISYAYDMAQHLTQVTSTLNDSQHPGTLLQPGLNEQYNASGQLESALLGNGLTETYAYNSRLRLTSGTIGSVYTFSVGHANDGVVTSSTDTVNGNWAYTYDQFNRLATAAESNQLDAAYNYQYDRFGNRWQQNLTAGSGYTSLWDFSDAKNQISSYATYDAAGNTMSDNVNTYTYDAENRLISMYNSYVGTYEYAYDAFGHRVEKAANNVAQEYYLYDLAGREVTRLNVSGAWLTGEVYAGAQHLATYGASTTTFNHSDWLGTERYRSTVSGGLQGSCQSLPFGDGFSCTADMSPLHFTGKEHDYESNLESFGARYYNSVYGRFVTPDWSAVPAPVPYADLTNPQSLNQYVIVQDNPNTFVDLNGHDFNVGCTAREGAEKSCQGGFLGTTDANGNFTPTQIGNDKNGNLVDQNGNQYNASVGPGGVSFTQAGVDNATPLSGVFMNGTNPTTIQGSGDLSGFSFTFTNSKMDANQTAAGTFTYSGTAAEAGAALETAGFSYHLLGEDFGMDEYRSSGSFLTGADSGHVKIYKINLNPDSSMPQAQGTMHFGEHNPFNPFGLLAHCLFDGAC
jgi:RHS repeat-associated protein